MKKTFFLSILVFTVFAGTAQTYNISNDTINTCTGAFHDTGGAGGDYNNSESNTETFCSDLPGSNLILTFTSFNSEQCCDHLYIYDGPDTTGNLLIQAEGSNPPGLVGAPFTSSTGCLTIKWVSDASVTGNGWVAAISCIFVCQPFTVNFVNSGDTSAIDTLHVCQSTPVDLFLSGTYPDNNINYQQSDSTTLFTWDFGDGSAPVSGTGLTSVSHTWPGGAYRVGVTATDINNCTNINSVSYFIIVSIPPVFSGTTTTPDTVCPGVFTVLSGNAQGIPWYNSVDTTIAGMTYLPDGQGVPYESVISNNYFLIGQTVTSVTDIESVCINMEHSYLGDLTIHLVCPNGQFLNIFTYPDGLGSTWFGVPIDNDQTTGPGTGWTYCWTSQATNPVPNMSNQSVPTGNYQPTGSFTDLLGCPLNGQWTMFAEDHLGSDNGYIFWWFVQFNQAIIPPQYSFTNMYDTSAFNWIGAGISSQDNGIAQAMPAVQGLNNYMLQVTDNFGCHYDTSISVFLLPADNPSCSTATGIAIDFFDPHGTTEKKNEIMIYPNPVNDILTVQNLTTGFYYQVIDPRGTIVLNGHFDQEMNKVPVTLLPDGLYFLKIITNENVFIKKFTKR